MSPSWRQLRGLVLTALSICLLWYGWLGEDAILPGGCWLGFDMFGRLIDTRSSAAVWTLIAGLVLLQGILIVALTRFPDSRRPSAVEETSELARNPGNGSIQRLSRPQTTH
jgi:hypothetical protein